MPRIVPVCALVCALTIFCPAFAAGDHHHHETPESAFGRPGDSKTAARTVTLEAADIAFNVKELTFKAGETVKFVLINKGEQNHELTIGDEAAQQEHRKLMAEMQDMGHAGMGASMHGHTPHGNAISVSAGETKSLIWQFTKPGIFWFACNYPGHAEAGMEGKITVTQ